MIGRRAEVLERCCLKPCWLSANVRWSWRYGRISRSSTLAAGLRREMGRYEELSSEGLPGLGMEDTVADFQTAGMSAPATDRLYKEHK